jgi:hypothetical protein
MHTQRQCGAAEDRADRWSSRERKGARAGVRERRLLRVPCQLPAEQVRHVRGSGCQRGGGEQKIERRQQRGGSCGGKWQERPSQPPLGQRGAGQVALCPVQTGERVGPLPFGHGAGCSWAFSHAATPIVNERSGGAPIMLAAVLVLVDNSGADVPTPATALPAAAASTAATGTV